MVSVRLVVEGLDLAVSAAAVERDGLAQGTVRLESNDLNSRVPGVPLQLLQQTPPEPKPTCLGRDPHPLQLGRPARMKLERPTADRLMTQARDEQSAGRWRQLVRIGGDAERRVEAGLEARIQLGEILLDAPRCVGRGRSLERDADH